MNDFDAEELRPLFEQLAGCIDPVNSDAYFEVVQKAADVQHIQANAAGFICAGIRLIKQGLNSAGLADDKPLTIDLQSFTIQKDKSSWLID